LKDLEELEFYRSFGSTAIPKLSALIERTRGKIGLIFSDKAAFELKGIIESNRVKTDAKVGMIS